MPARAAGRRDTCSGPLSDSPIGLADAPGPNKAVERVNADIHSATFLEKARDFAVTSFSLAQLADQIGVGFQLGAG
ncbi:MAG TPA: hypothetical protein VN736_22075 [Candidatus Limnocylindrales bacterium]|nr:hypothetical protein [Candidatus Limnocylindrales bacterium]